MEQIATAFAYVLAALDGDGVAVACALHPCLGSIGSEALEIDVVAVGGHFANSNRGIAVGVGVVVDSFAPQ